MSTCRICLEEETSSNSLYVSASAKAMLEKYMKNVL